MRVRKITAVLVAAGAVGLLALSAPLTASAATGSSNWGMTNLKATPTAPAVNFATAGTAGTLTFNTGDGGPQGSANIVSGDSIGWTVQLPAGLRFSDPCPANGGGNTYTCSADGRSIQYRYVASSAWVDNSNRNAQSRSFNIVSTGPVSGVPTGTAQPWTGLTTRTPSATGTVEEEPPVDTPVLAGGALGVLALVGAGTVLAVRRRRVAAE